MNTAPQIYVASLADYNAGHHHGAWFDADQEPETLREEIAEMLAKSTESDAEGWEIHDAQGFYSVSIGKNTDLETVAAIAAGIVEDGEPFAAWLADLGQSFDDIDELRETFNDHYEGYYACTRDYAEQLAEDLGIYQQIQQSFPYETARTYVCVNLDQWAYDLEIEMTILEASDGGVYVFTP